MPLPRVLPGFYSTRLATVFVVLVCLLLLFIDSMRSWEAKERRLSEAEMSTSNMTWSLAQHAEATLKEVDSILIGLVERVGVDGAEPPAIDRLRGFLSSRVASVAQLHSLSVFDRYGRLLVDSQTSISAPRYGADQEYFIHHRDHVDTGPYIGVPIKSKTAGGWIITLSRTIKLKDGSFGGVALANIDIRHFQQFYDSFDIGRNGMIYFALDKGIVLARRPLRNDSVGKDISNAPAFREYIAHSKSGTILIRSSQDEVERIVSYRHLDGYPMYVAAALSKEEVLAPWLADTYLHSAGVLVLASVLGVLGSRLVAQLRLRIRAERDALEARVTLEKLNQTLEKLALQDSLTRLANRRQFDIVIEDELNRAKRNRGSLALILIDVDHFKQYNDIYGHQAGDACLRQIGNTLKSFERRSGDLAARYGGEEFTVILSDTDRAGATIVARNVCQAVRNLGIAHSASPGRSVTISIGVSAFDVVVRDDTADALIDNADQAMYMAKAAGRDQVRLFIEP